MRPELLGDGAGDAAAGLLRVLDALDANLRAEQRALAELDFLLFTQLLTPVQVGCCCCCCCKNLACRASVCEINIFLCLYRRCL